MIRKLFNWMMRVFGRWRWMRAYEKSLNDRVKVEQALLDVANGKEDIPVDREQFRQWAFQLGVPAEWRD